MRLSRLLAVLAALGLLVSPAASQGLPDPKQTDPGVVSSGDIPVSMGGAEVLGAENLGVTSAPTPVSLEEPINATTYVCGPGDVFELNFWGKQNFRLRITVDLEGRTFISKVGYVSVAGKTLTTVRGDIKKKVHANYPGLMFDLTLISPRTFLVHVVNNVKQPGTYKAQPVERVSSVLARAVNTGSRRRVRVRRRDGKELTADLVMYELTGDTKYNPQLLDGDVVDVPAPTLVATIAGAVRRPGSYELISSTDLVELVTVAGGVTSAATSSLPIRIARRNQHDQTNYVNVTYQRSAIPATKLADEDFVTIPGTDELQRSVTLLGAVVATDEVDAATTSRRLPFVEGDTVRSVLDRAGGIRASGDLRRAYISRPQKRGPPKIIGVDLDALLVKRDFKGDQRVEIGDTIVVPPLQYSVMVEGAVARSGLYPYNPKFGVLEYIARAGGRTRTARELGDVQLIDSDGKTHSYKHDLKLAPGDSILVPERDFTRGEVAQLVLAGAGVLLSGIAITIAATR